MENFLFWKFPQRQSIFFLIGNLNISETNHEKCELSNIDLNGELITNGNSATAVSDHIQFLITETGLTTPRTPKTPTSKNNIDSDNESEDFKLIASAPMISPSTFRNAFPFHLMFNREMKIVQSGKSVSRIIPKIADYCYVTDILDPIRPHIQLSFESILAHINTIYVLKTKTGVMLNDQRFLRLKVMTKFSSPTKTVKFK